MPKLKKSTKIFGYFLLYSAMLGWGYLLLRDVNLKGYYTDHKHGLSFAGNEARLTAHVMIAFSICGMIYTGTSFIRARRDEKPPNQAL